MLIFCKTSNLPKVVEKYRKKRGKKTRQMIFANILQNIAKSCNISLYFDIFIYIHDSSR